MSEPARFGVFYSKGRSYLDVLRCVKQHEPESRVIAVVPPGYPISDEEEALAEAVIRTGHDRYGLRHPGALRRLVASLRGARYDCFVITFDSPKLRILAALSGARSPALVTLDGRLAPFRPSIAGTVADAVCRHLWGRAVFGWIWLVVRCTRVRPPAEAQDR